MEILRTIFCCSESFANVCDDQEYTLVFRQETPFNKASAFVTSPFYEMWSSSLESGSASIIIPVDQREYESMRNCRIDFNQTVLALSLASGYNVLNVLMVVDICIDDAEESFSRGFALVSWAYSDEVADMEDYRRIMKLKNTC